MRHSVFESIILFESEVKAKANGVEYPCVMKMPGYSCPFTHLFCCVNVHAKLSARIHFELKLKPLTAPMGIPMTITPIRKSRFLLSTR